jgi:hypothetical protein
MIGKQPENDEGFEFMGWIILFTTEETAVSVKLRMKPSLTIFFFLSVVLFGRD